MALTFRISVAKADGGVEWIDSNLLMQVLTPYRGASRVQVLAALSRASCFGSHPSNILLYFYNLFLTKILPFPVFRNFSNSAAFSISEKAI